MTLLVCLSAVIPSKNTVVMVTKAAILLFERFSLTLLAYRGETTDGKHFSDIIRISL